MTAETAQDFNKPLFGPYEVADTHPDFTYLLVPPEDIEAMKNLILNSADLRGWQLLRIKRLEAALDKAIDRLDYQKRLQLAHEGDTKLLAELRAARAGAA